MIYDSLILVMMESIVLVQAAQRLLLILREAEVHWG
jgi:hypothetical protein